MFTVFSASRVTRHCKPLHLVRSTILLALAAVLVACSVAAFTLLTVQTPQDPLAANEVGFVEFEFSMEEGSEPQDPVLVVLQVPDTWLVLDGFIGRSPDGDYLRLPPLSDALAAAVDEQTLPQPEPGMQRVTRRLPPGVEPGQLPDRGFLAFVPEHGSAAVGDIKAAVGTVVDNGYVSLVPSSLPSGSFSDVPSATGQNASDLQFAEKAVETDPAPLTITAAGGAASPDPDLPALRIAPRFGTTPDVNQYGYRVYLARTDDPATVDETSGGSVPLTGALVAMNTEPGGDVTASLSLDGVALDSDTLYHVDLPVYVHPREPGLESATLALEDLPDDGPYHVAAVSLTTTQNAPGSIYLAGLLDTGEAILFRPSDVTGDYALTATVQGRLLQDGEPMAGFPVAVESPDLDGRGEEGAEGNTFQSAFVRTDMDGRFTVYTVPGQNYRLVLDGYRDGDTQPGERFPFRAYYNGPDGVSGVTTSNQTSEGNFTRTRTRLNEHTYEYADRMRLETDGVIDLPAIDLPNVHSVSGTVVDGSGDPMPSLRVLALVSGASGRTSTDAQGHYEILAYEGRDYRLLVGGCEYNDEDHCNTTHPTVYYAGPASGLSDGDFDDRGAGFSDATVLNLTGDVGHVNVRMPITHRVTGTLLVDGEPSGTADDWNIQLQSAEQGHTEFADFDPATGEFVFPFVLPADDYQLGVWRDGGNQFVGYYHDEDPAGTRYINETTLLAIDGDRDDLLMDLFGPEALTAVVEGRVLRDGEPLAGVPVSVRSTDLDDDGQQFPGSSDQFTSSQYHGELLSGEDGRFQVPVLPGSNYTVTLGGSDEESSPELPLWMYYNGPDDVAGVTTDNENDAANYSRNFSQWNDGITDYADRLHAGDGETITLPAVEAPHVHSLAGSVVDAQGNPLPRIDVQVLRSTGESRAYRTDDAGQFLIHEIAGESYRIMSGGCIRDADFNCIEHYVLAGYTGAEQGLTVDEYDATLASREEATTIVLDGDVANLNMQLEEARSLSGTVTVDGGPPPEGTRYSVNAYSDSLDRGTGMTTEWGSGTFSLEGLAPVDDYRLYVFRDEGDSRLQFEGYYVGNEQPAVKRRGDATLLDMSGDREGITLDLLGPASLGSISGSLSFPAGSADALVVSVHSQTVGGDSRKFTLSPEQTELVFAFDSLLPADDYALTVHPQDSDLQWGHYAGSASGEDSGHTRHWDERTLLSVQAGESLEGVQLELPAGISLSGTVEVSGESACDTAPGCEVQVNAGSQSLGSGSGQTIRIQTAEGIGSAPFTLRGLEPADDYRVEAQARDTALLRQFYAGTPDGAVHDQALRWSDATLLDPADEALAENGVTIQLSAGSQLSGTLALEQTATEEEWIHLRLHSPDLRSSFGAPVRIRQGDDSVDYSLTVPPAGDYRLSVAGGSWSLADRDSLPDAIDLTGAAALDLNLTQGHRITGSVVDDQGDPVEGVSVGAEPYPFTPGNSSRWTTTDGNGAFSIEGLDPSQDYRVLSFPEGYGRTSMNDRDRDGTVDDQPDPVVTVADRSGGLFDSAGIILSQGETISGVMLDGEGVPLADVYVHAHDVDSGSGSDARTAEDGSFTLYGLLAGTDYNLWLSHRTLGSRSAGSRAAGSADVELTLDSGHSLEGRVTDEADTGVGGGYVTVYRDVDTDGAFSSTTDDFVDNYALDEQGRFAVRGLRAGNYFIRPRVGGYAFAADRHPDSSVDDRMRYLALSGDVEDYSVRVRLIEDDIHGIRGTVTNSDSIGGIDRIEVVAIQGGEIAASLTTEIDGGFTFDTLFAETHDVYVYAYNADGLIVGTSTVKGIEATEAGADAGTLTLEAVQ